MICVLRGTLISFYFEDEWGLRTNISMKRLILILTMILISSLYTISASAQANWSIAAVSFVNDQPNCSGQGFLNVSVSYNGDATAFVTVSTGETVHRNVTRTMTSVTATTLGPGATFDGLIRVIVRFGPVRDSSAYDSRVYWFNCGTGGTVDDSIFPQNDRRNVPEGFTSQINVLANDFSEIPLGIPQLKIAPNFGTAVRVTNFFEYTPNPGFIGNDSFVYTICNIGGVCRDATVFLNVFEVRDPEIQSATLTSTTCNGSGNLRLNLYYAGGPAFVTVISGITEIVDLTTSDTSLIGNRIIHVPISSAGVVVPTNAVAVTVRYGIAPDDGTFHDQVYWFDCNTGAPINTQVNAVNDSATALENFPLTIDVASNDLSILQLDFDTLSIVSAPSRGSVTIGANGELTYVYGSNSDFSGTDSFDYEICNVAGECDTATVTVTIIDLPPPTIDNLELVDFACEGPGSIEVTVTFSGGPAVITAITGITSSVDISSNDISTFGTQIVTLAISSDNGGVQGDNVLIIDLRYGTSVGDSSHDSNIYYFDCVTGEPIVPVVDAVDDYVPEVGRSIPTEIDALANDSSRLPLDGSTLAITSDPSVGTVEIVNGILVYTGDGVTLGETSFTYEICNTQDFCDEATVTVNLVNLPPVCEGSSTIFVEVWPPNHSLVPITIEGVFDPDGDPINFELISVTIYEEGYSWEADLDEIDFDAENGLIRAERSGNGNGRIYAVEYIALDPDASFCDGFAYIYVPHDQRHHGCEIPGFDIDGAPFPVLPELCENGNNGNGNGNGRGNGNGAPVVASPPVDSGGDGVPPAGTVETTPPPVSTPEPSEPGETPEDSGGGNNGLGNDKDKGNAQGDPQRDNNNGNANGNGNGNDSGDPGNPVASDTPEDTDGNNDSSNGNANGNGNGNSNGNANGNGNGNN